MEEKEVKEKAKQISKIIIETNTDFRGELFLEIFENLHKEMQYFTSSGFLKLASEHGIKNNKNGRNG